MWGLLVPGRSRGTPGPSHSLQGRQLVVGEQGLGQEGGTVLLDHVVLQAARREEQAVSTRAGGTRFISAPPDIKHPSGAATSAGRAGTPLIQH